MRRLMIGLAIALASTSAYADDRAKAKQLYDEGLRHYQVAEYTQAIDVWKQAYLISKKPLLLFNIGQATRLSGDCKQAQTFYDNYQEAEPNPSNQDELTRRSRRARTRRRDGPRGWRRDPDRVDADPPRLRSTRTRPDQAVDDLEVPGERPPVHRRRRSRPGPTRRAGGKRTAGIIVGIGGMVLEGGAVVFALQGKSKASDAERSPPGTSTRWICSRQASATTSRVGLGIAGGAAIVAGVVLA